MMKQKKVYTLHILTFNNQYVCSLKMCLTMDMNTLKIYECSTNFLINYYENSDICYTLQIDVDYPEYSHPLHIDLPFFASKK